MSLPLTHTSSGGAITRTIPKVLPHSRHRFRRSQNYHFRTRVTLRAHDKNPKPQREGQDGFRRPLSSRAGDSSRGPFAVTSPPRRPSACSALKTCGFGISLPGESRPGTQRDAWGRRFLRGRRARRGVSVVTSIPREPSAGGSPGRSSEGFTFNTIQDEDTYPSETPKCRGQDGRSGRHEQVQNERAAQPRGFRVPTRAKQDV